jgi:hypothetical protein
VGAAAFAGRLPYLVAAALPAAPLTSRVLARVSHGAENLAAKGLLSHIGYVIRRKSAIRQRKSPQVRSYCDAQFGVCPGERLNVAGFVT